MADVAKYDPTSLIASELDLPAPRVAAVLQLLGTGNTVPFVARYRKEQTGSLDEIQIRAIEERAGYLAELDKRRRTVLAAIEEQGKLTDALAARIAGCATKAELEDLYLPFKRKRRTRASIARERGLEPLARMIREQPPEGDPLAAAARFADPAREIPDPEAALAGARDIVAEDVAEIAELRARIRRRFAEQGLLVARVRRGQADEGSKFKDYFDHQEPAARAPSHRVLALLRGEREKVLKVEIDVAEEQPIADALAAAGHRVGSPFAGQLELAAADSYRRLIAPSVQSDVLSDLKDRADEAAVQIFAANLRNLLLAPPFGGRPVIGVDPGLRTGCKCAAVDATGRFEANITFNLVQGEQALERGRQAFVTLVERHRPAAIAVGNGTGGREAERFARETLGRTGHGGVLVVLVSEAGASVYSASPIAHEEFPDLDLTIRGAISIARRLQDPLAELVKIEPRAIGVGQYQHDVNQTVLARKLDEVVESCVGAVGVELNTASAALLARVAGVGPKLAQGIVAHREQHGAFANRRELARVKGLGARTFEQAAGFLRIRGGVEPLDASAVHPERYALVGRIARDLGRPVAGLIGDAGLASTIEIGRYVDDEVGEPTLRDIVEELKKPGRDPREEFAAPEFREDVQRIEDLAVGMRLEGVVTNVTAFGAFVDVGVHRDGLVHVSQLADRFVKDPAEVVKVGDRISVRVLEVDLARQRISFSARSDGGKRQPPAAGQRRAPAPAERGRPAKPEQPGFSYNPFADQLKKR